jgi:hypothetical protein
MDTEAPAMKRLLALVLLLALVGATSATSLNFQNPGDINSVIKFHTGTPTSNGTDWVESTVGGNNYLNIYFTEATGGVSNDAQYIILPYPSQSNYAAATLISSSGTYTTFGGGPSAVLLDSNKNVIWNFNRGGDGGIAPTGRYEVKVSGGTAYYYINGVLNQNSTPLATNPYYIGFGAKVWQKSNIATQWDDYVYGESENKFILGVSESDDNKFIILDDILSDAGDGLYNTTSDTQANANYMPATWARGNATIGADVSQPNMSVQLVSYPDNTPYATYYTDTGYSGSINVEIKTYLIDAGAPDGYYAMYMPGTGAYSNIIMKKSNGATVSFNADTYSTGDTATIITYVATGGYWDTSSFDYKLSLYGLTTGYVENYTITMQSGTFTHAWESTDTPGVYYALLYATSRTTGKEAILGLDWATLSSYAGYAGYVNDAQTGSTISGAFINVTQDGVSGNSTSGFDGNWSSGSVFSTGSILMINASASGYDWYNYSWTPMAARTVSDLNVTLAPISKSYTGLAIGGVVRDFLYGRPIEGATVTVRNITTGLYCYKTTSFTGWYLNDETDCLFQSKTPYDVWAHKIGYTNSTTEQAVTA